MIVSEVLAHILQTGQVPDWYATDDFLGAEGHGVRRLVAAMRAGASGLDWAVLVRQCLRRLRHGERVLVRQLDARTQALLDDVDVRQEIDGTLIAESFRPEWVVNLGGQAVDRPRTRTALATPPLAGEPWLRRMLGMSTWKSHAQREATWHALNARANSTLLVGLPTGSGKSLVYQSCAAFEAGLTVVVVPTVALGIDQLAAVRLLPFSAALEPMLYTPGPDAQMVLEAVQARRCRLLITSPEAIVAGRLASPLRRHASEGFLRRLVVDEAHLIESWGADFRVEFQLLGAVLRDWRSLAPSGIKALLLSATFSPSTPPMLQSLFAADEGGWRAHIVQRLRPEIHYFAVPNWVHAEEQVQRVTEALRRLPRPAILYVTEVDDARMWGDRLRSAGFSRYRVFHGDTPAAERKAIMAAWRRDEIDLVVATSAFGMGVDKPDVKAVVHACFPEGIDRFYQEVGRGGRDGDPCTSLLIPKLRDARVARTMGPTLLKDAEKVNGRWRAMWGSREAVLDATGELTDMFRIKMNVQPEHRFGRQSFKENERWNKRLLLMMDRAGLIRIQSLAWERPQEDSDPVECFVIRPRVSTLQMEGGLSEMLSDARAREIVSIERSVDALLRYFRQERAVCRELKKHYGPETSRSCGSCGACRSHSERPAAVGPLELEEEPASTTPPVDVVQAPALDDVRSRFDLVQALRQVLQSHGVRRFVLGASNRPAIEALLERADDGSQRPYRIDELGQEPPPDVQPDEAVIVFHVAAVDERAAIYNYRGRWVAHWLLGGALETGRWPFMHEHASRVYPGHNGLSQWLNDARRFEAPH